MDKSPKLVSLDRKDTYCILSFSDDKSFKLDYVEVRKNCQCAKCKPRQVNEQMKIEFEEEISRMMLVKPKVNFSSMCSMQDSLQIPLGFASLMYRSAGNSSSSITIQAWS